MTVRSDFSIQGSESVAKIGDIDKHILASEQSKNWTKDEDSKVKWFWNSDTPRDEILKALPGRSWIAIASRAAKLEVKTPEGQRRRRSGTEELVCVCGCGRTFTADNIRRIYATPSCATKTYSMRKAIDSDHRCQWCGELLLNSTAKFHASCSKENMKVRVGESRPAKLSLRGHGYMMLMFPINGELAEEARSRGIKNIRGAGRAEGRKNAGCGLGIYEHHFVWEKANGPLKPHESVHHKNGDRADNRLENLELLHRHHAGQKVSDLHQEIQYWKNLSLALLSIR